MISYFEPDIRTAQDYYPFGMLMPGRKGFASGTAWVVEGSGSSLPASLSYSSRTGNTPLEYKASSSIEFTEGFETGTGDEFVAYITTDGGTGGSSGIEGSEEIYRYGFNGKENDNELKGEGAQQDYGMRIYDPRLGKFLSVDPLVKSYPELTPYQFASNIPIAGIDQDGLEFGINKWLFDIWVDLTFGSSTGHNDLVGGAVEKARIETGQMSYHNEHVPKSVQNKLDQFNLNNANAKIAGGTARATTFIVETSADIASMGIPLGEIKVSGKFLSRISKLVGNSNEAKKLIRAGTYDFKELEGVRVVSNKSGQAYHGMEFLDDGARMVEQPLSNKLNEVWNLGESVVTKEHHNWNKIFGNQAIKVSDVEPIIKEAVKTGEWKTTGTIRGKGGKIIGEKMEMVSEVNGNKIWVGGMKTTEGKIFINNAAVQ